MPTKSVIYDVYRQDVYKYDEPPGPGWEPFQAQATVGKDYNRELDTDNEIIWWRKPRPVEETANVT